MTRPVAARFDESTRRLSLENATLSVVVALDRGADIREIRHRASDVNVLWEAPHPAPEPAGGPGSLEPSMVEWIRRYRGGWQTILPNFGPAVVHQGRPLPFHGEAARVAWRLDGLQTSEDGLQADVSTELTSLPLTVSRRMRLASWSPVLAVRETVTNQSSAPVACMWGHHPVFGAPLVAPGTRIVAAAGEAVTDPLFTRPSNDLLPGARFMWPAAPTSAGSVADVSHVPSPAAGLSRVIWLDAAAAPWCAVLNTRLPLGVGLRWNAGVMPHLCLWQEAGGAAGYPFTGRAYAVGVEPHSSRFGHGLLDAVATTRTALWLGPGEARTFDLQLIVDPESSAVLSFCQQHAASTGDQ